MATTTKIKRCFVGAYVGLDTVELIKAEAKREGRSISDTVRRLLKRAVKSEKVA